MTKARDDLRYKEPIKGINLMLIVYFVLTIYENILNTGSGSILKYYGYVIIIAIILYKRKIEFSSKIVPLLVWITVCACSLLWSTGVSDGLEYVLSAGNMAVITVLVFSLDWNQREIDALLISYIISAFVFSLILIVGGTGFRYTSLRMTVTILGKQYDPNVVVAYLVPAVMIVMVLYLQKKIKPLFATIFVIAMLYASFLANSRGGLLSFLVAIVCLTLMLLVKGNKKNKIKYVIIVAILGAIAIYIIDKYVDPYLIDRVFNISFSEGSSVERIGLVESAWRMFLDKPFFGYGCGGANATTHQGTHNMYMLVLSETGLIGFIPFILFLTKMAFDVWKTKYWSFCSVLIAMYGVIFFLDSYHAKYMWNIVIFAMILIRYERQECLLSEEEDMHVVY